MTSNSCGQRLSSRRQQLAAKKQHKQELQGVVEQSTLRMAKKLAAVEHLLTQSMDQDWIAWIQEGEDQGELPPTQARALEAEHMRERLSGRTLLKDMEPEPEPEPEPKPKSRDMSPADLVHADLDDLEAMLSGYLQPEPEPEPEPEEHLTSLTLSSLLDEPEPEPEDSAVEKFRREERARGEQRNSWESRVQSIMDLDVVCGLHSGPSAARTPRPGP